MAKKTEPKSTPATPAKRAASKPAAETTKTVTAKPKPAPKAKKPKAPAKASAYSNEDVALRAYFISEKRRAHGLSGDEHQDWLEAERQLAAEAALPRKAAKATKA